MKNVIIDFIEKGGDLLSEEGKNLIINCERVVVKEAAQNHDVLEKLCAARSATENVLFRRKILLALSD